MLVLLAAPPSASADDREALLNVVLSSHAMVWSAGRVDRIPAIYAETFEGHFPGGVTVHGRDGIAERVESLRGAFPDWQEDILDTVVDGSTVVVRFRSRGTNKGPFLGNPPTNASIEIEEIAMYEIVDGLIARQWVFPDIISMQNQIGEATPCPPRDGTPTQQ